MGTDKPPTPTARPAVELVFEIAVILLTANGFLALLAANRLDIFSILVMAAALGGRLFLISSGRVPPLSRASVSLLSLAYVLFFAFDFWVLGGFIAAAVRMLFFFTALRLITAEQNRDYLLLGVMAFLQLMLVSMFVAGMGFLAALAGFLVLTVLAYTVFEIRRGCRSAAVLMGGAVDTAAGRLGRRLLLLSAALAVGILVLSFALFWAIPRSFATNWTAPLRGDYTVGFSDEVNLGATGSVAIDHTPVLRVEEASGVDLRRLKWRGLALHHFDGIRWSNPTPEEKLVEPRKGQYLLPGGRRGVAQGPRVHYQVDVAPMTTRFLFVAGEPEVIAGRFSKLWVTNTGSYRAPLLPYQPLRYQVQGRLPAGEPPPAANVVELFSDKFRSLYLDLPPLDPRIEALARRLAKPHPGARTQAAAIERYFRTEFGYSLALPEQRAADPLGHFVFERREGHCEYFASAMAVMLRSLGTPTRLVNGFLGGVYNPLSGRQVIRSSDAHSWVEAYLPGRGWVEFDPTPPGPNQAMGFWATYSWMYWDLVQSAWSDWVVGYDRGQQVMLVREMQTRSRRALMDFAASVEQAGSWLGALWRDLRAALGGDRFGGLDGETFGEPSRGAAPALIGLIIAGIGAVWGARKLRPRLVRFYRGRRVLAGRGRLSDAVFFYERALDLTARRGFTRRASQTAEEFTESVEAEELRGIFQQITNVYNRARFGADRSAEKRLPKLLQALERSR